MAVDRWLSVGDMDRLGRLDSPMHRLDARIKAVVTLAFIGVVVSFPRYEVSALTPFLLYPVVLASAGGIPTRAIVRKLLVAAPFALIIGIFNPLLDREPMAQLGTLFISGGWVSFTSIMMRFVLTVGAALALVACTGMYRLAAGLERLGVPRVFVVQLLVLYRYLSVLTDQGSKMVLAVELRSAGAPTRLRAYGSLLGHLLLRTMDRAARIHRAMVARGFDGEILTLRERALCRADLAFAGTCLLLFAVARRWNLAAELGALLGRTPS